MKNRKIVLRSIQQSPYSKPTTISSTSRFNIKFDFTRSNLSCFIDQKRQIKKTLYKRQQSNKTRKPQSKRKSMKVIGQQKASSMNKSISNIKKRNQQSPDIIKQASNSILNQIQNKGIRCKWKQNDIQINQNETGQTKLNNQHQDQLQNDNQIWSVFSLNNQSVYSQKSYASTMDYHPQQYHSVDYNNNTISPLNQNYINNNQYMYLQLQMQYKQPIQSYDNNIFEVMPDQIGYDPRTTIMIRNIPNKYTIKQLSEEIDYYFDNTYDFLYLPCDLKNQCNVGYGFINFVNTIYLRDFYLAFHNHKWAKFRSQKICNLTYARLQGLNSLIQHFQNSKVLNQKDKKYRPIIKQNPKLQNLIKKQQQK